jgi:hypothetical protein
MGRKCVQLPQTHTWRACLRCQQGFLSTGNDHRICDPCKQKAEAQPSDEVVYSCVRGTLD